MAVIWLNVRKPFIILTCFVNKMWGIFLKDPIDISTSIYCQCEVRVNERHCSRSAFRANRTFNTCWHSIRMSSTTTTEPVWWKDYSASTRRSFHAFDTIFELFNLGFTTCWFMIKVANGLLFFFNTILVVSSSKKLGGKGQKANLAADLVETGKCGPIEMAMFVSCPVQ